MKSALYALAPDAVKNAYQRAKKLIGADVHVHVDRTILRHVARYVFADDILSGRDILDVACGSGYGALVLGRAGSYRGIDLDLNAIREARRTFPEFSYERGSIYSLSFPKDSLSGVTSFETLEHVDQPERAMAEIARVLAPGGLLVGSIPINHPDRIHHFKPYSATEAFAIFNSVDLAVQSIHIQSDMAFRSVSSVEGVDAGTLVVVLKKA